jgi:light-regulated signal transduction histidine kinase (bacteriophytochrome)/CheY-like chemotaxis protein
MPKPKPPVVDLTNCEREPIHIPGSIQTHGALLACDDALTTIRRASANASQLLGLDGKSLIGMNLDEALGAAIAHEVRNAASASPSKPALLLDLRPRDRDISFDMAVHHFNGAGIVELEPASDQRSGPLEVSRTLISSASQFVDSDTMLKRTPRLVRGALGYGRVMIYRFTHDGAGQVIGESKRSDLESFLGQYFPASDIPQQARALYLRNTIRVISDASGAAFPIEPALDASGEALDLSHAHLRSVSPIHLEYLRNMGVAASMSISIIVGGQLWGLIACHHYAPRALSMAQRTAAEMFGGFFSLQLEVLLQKERLDSASRARRALDRVMREVAYRGDIVESLREKMSDFASFMPCDGVGLYIGGKWSDQGVSVSPQGVAALTKLLANTAQGKVWATHDLSSHVPASAWDSSIAGVLAIPLSQIPKDYLLCFRREVVQTIEWGGDPNKTYETGPLGDRLTPRKSFAIWKETVERQSTPWTDDDREMAEATRTALLEVIMRHTEILETERRTSDLRQKLLNEELNHRVKNILALIKSLVSQPPEPGRQLSDYVDALKGRIMALAHAHDQVVRNDGGGALKQLLDAELTPYRASAISMDGPAVVLDARAYSVMALVLHELATNAAKYGALSSPSGRLDLGWRWLENGDLEINWRESGGPAVTPPTRHGFGNILLKRSIPFDLGGESHLSYEPAGVVARFVVPQKFVSTDERAVAARPGAAQEEPTAAQALAGLAALVVEDQLIIAMDAETILMRAGVRSVDTAATASEALRLLSAARPDFCVLDVNLGSETSIPVAQHLRKAGIPFIFATGYGDTANIPREMADVIVVRKPYDGDALIAAIDVTLKRGF